MNTRRPSYLKLLTKILAVVFLFYYEVVLVHILDRLLLQLESPLQTNGAVVEELEELRVELVFHSLDVVNRKTEHLRVLDSLDCELALHFEAFLLHLLNDECNVSRILDGHKNYVELTKDVAYVDFDIDDILFEWKDEPCVSNGQKVDSLYHVGLVVDDFVNREEVELQKGANPAKEVLSLT